MCAVRVPSAVPARPPVVLIVDRDADTCALYEHAFEVLGYEVLKAYDGREAMIKAFVRPPALVVMEIGPAARGRVFVNENLAVRSDDPRSSSVDGDR
jgi:DNA-binding response OmpR family regulator